MAKGLYKGLSTLGLFAALCLSSAPAFGFCRTTTCSRPNPPADCIRDLTTQCWLTGEPIFWEQACVSFSVHVEGAPRLGLDYDSAEAAVVSAFSVWPTADCGNGFPSISVQSLSPSTCGETEFNPTGPNANVVVFRGETWPHDPRQIALTSVSFSARTGKIYDADMEINTVDYPQTPESLKYVIAHESGHFFGLDHSSTFDSLMFAEYFQAPDDDDPLTDDDIQGICAVYPPGREAPAECEPEPEFGFARDCGGNVEGSCNVSGRPRGEHAEGALALGFLLAVSLVRRKAAKP